MDEQKEYKLENQSLKQEIEQLKLSNINIEDYESWNHEHILTWIMSIDNGIFKRYKDILNKTLSEEDVKGIDLKKVDALDVKGWGIVNFGDRKTLYEEIQSLVHGNNDNEVALIANEEGAESGGYFK